MFNFLGEENTTIISKSNDNSDNVAISVSFREDQVTIQESMPKWLVKDPFEEGKYNFKMRRFKIVKYVARPELQNSDELKTWTWVKFNNQVSDIATILYKELNKVYRSGISSKFRRHISAAVTLTFPELESTYERLRQASLDEEMIGLKKTTLKPDTLTVNF